MDKFKGKYEIILGFVTLVVSLSAFKDELSKINIDLGFTSISFAQYFLYCVIGFSLCLYFYVVEFTARETKIGHWKFFDYLILLAYIIFVFILLSPLLILINVTIVKSYNYLVGKLEKEKAEIFSIILIVINGLSILISFFEGKKLFKKRQDDIKDEAEINQIKEIEIAKKLFQDAYYSQSILEAFKALESHLQKEVLQKNQRAPKALYELLSISQKLGIIKAEEQSQIKDLLRMRIISAHKTEITLTKADAEKALKFVEYLIRR